MTDIENTPEPDPTSEGGTVYDNPNQEVVRPDGSGPGIEEEAPPPEGDEDSPEVYDPSGFTVAEVQDYVDAHPDDRAAIAEAERAGKARTTLLDWFDE